MKTLTILGRRWFQKTYGNTYHSATILIDGEEVHKTPEEYGYGDQYLQTAVEWLIKHKFIPDVTNHEGIGPIWKYCETKGITLHYSASDVSREKDL